MDSILNRTWLFEKKEKKKQNELNKKTYSESKTNQIKKWNNMEENKKVKI